MGQLGDVVRIGADRDCFAFTPTTRTVQ